MSEGNIMGYHIRECDIRGPDRTIPIRLHLPEHQRPMSDRVLLLSFAGDRETSLTVAPYRLASEVFLEEGHNVLSIDLPNHGSQINDDGEGIPGMRNAFIGGRSPFEGFVGHAGAAIDYCVAEGIAEPGRITACGTSRGGYMALRLLAQDERIVAGTGFSPVTDWRYLSEFDSDSGRPNVAALALSNYTRILAEKAVFLAIGSNDKRVNSSSCLGLSVALHEARRKAGHSSDGLEFHCTEDTGHSCGDSWYRKGAQFLLEQIT